METKLSTSILERIQNVYQEYPAPFWVLVTVTLIDRAGLGYASESRLTRRISGISGRARTTISASSPRKRS